ncbi:probable disease resistance protein At1g59620 [Panicum hallii]|jgi:hypothetical protein|uniref:probable disease resistance protein At1g59620 n=1 Tax=Panicum hallii TaxID=206008 RepID=UPI000DF4E03D|nr:probable disease resistance protein At1g59620 [Panicum hallii]
MERASVAAGAMASLAAKLNSIIMPRYELMAGARADALFLRAELGSMHAFLERLSAAPDPDAQARAWVREVRELAYDVEDAVDEFMHRVDAAHGVAAPPNNHGSGTLQGFVSRVARLASAAWTRLRLANELKGLKARAAEVSERRSRYKYGEDIYVLSGDHTVADPRINALYADTPDLVGVGGPMVDIVEWVMGGATATLKVLSIVGPGGLGKTTLAMEVFRRVGGQFGCRAFAPVSQKLDMKKLLKDLLSQVAQGGADCVDSWEEGQLIRKLRECLINRR